MKGSILIFLCLAFPALTIGKVNAKPAAHASIKIISSLPLKVSIDSTVADCEDTVTLNVSLQNIPPEGITSCLFNVQFDSELLNIISFDAGEIVPFASDMEFSPGNQQGSLNVLFLANSSDGAIAQEGILAVMSIYVKGSSQGFSEVLLDGESFSDINFNSIPFIESAGGIQLVPKSNLNREHVSSQKIRSDETRFIRMSKRQYSIATSSVYGYNLRGTRVSPSQRIAPGVYLSKSTR